MQRWKIDVGTWLFMIFETDRNFRHDMIEGVIIQNEREDKKQIKLLSDMKGFDGHMMCVTPHEDVLNLYER